jgi:hypothetical protein
LFFRVISQALSEFRRAKRTEGNNQRGTRGEGDRKRNAKGWWMRGGEGRREAKKGTYLGREKGDL